MATVGIDAGSKRPRIQEAERGAMQCVACVQQVQQSSLCRGQIAQAAGTVVLRADGVNDGRLVG